jgi:hypothetical protein
VKSGSFMVVLQMERIVVLSEDREFKLRHTVTVLKKNHTVKKI